MDEQIEESKLHAAQFTATLLKAQKRFAALAKGGVARNVIVFDQ